MWFGLRVAYVIGVVCCVYCCGGFAVVCCGLLEFWLGWLRLLGGWQLVLLIGLCIITCAAWFLGLICVCLLLFGLVLVCRFGYLELLCVWILGGFDVSFTF